MSEDEATFEGFPPPVKNFFSLPNEMINIIAHIKNMAELKVIIYVIRHTWGFHEYGICKTISVDEFMHGRRKGDGSRMDEGTGLSHHSVIDGLRDAEEHGYLICKIDGSDLARVKKSYMLKMISRGEEVAPPEDTAPPEDVAPGAESAASSATSAPGSEESALRSEKDTLEKHLSKDKEESSALKEKVRQKLTDPELRAITEEMLASGNNENETQYHIAAAAIGNDADGDETPTVKAPVVAVTQAQVPPQAPGASRAMPLAITPPGGRHGDTGSAQATFRSGVPDPAQFSPAGGVRSPAAASPAPGSGADTSTPQMALTAKQIKAQNERRAKEIWAIVERTLKTKFSATQRRSENNVKGMENLIEDEIIDEELEAALKKVPAFYVLQFNLKKFHEMIPGLTAEAQEPPPRQNGKAEAPPALPRKNFTGMGQQLKAARA